MKLLAILVALFFVLVGVTGLLAPDSLLYLLQYSVTPAGLYAVAALRVGIGLVILGAASRSRTPKTFRVLGIVAVIAGITTPLLGAEHARAIMDWWLAQGSMPLRLWSLVALVLGIFIMYSIVYGRRTA